MKQVIVVDESLKLPPGKLAAQVAHAAVAAFLEATTAAQRRWLAAGMPKVVLRCGSETELLALLAQAEQASVPVAPIRDAGHTVVAAGTLTCIGFGPATSGQLDAITGTLKLVR
jgi:peptidyl-tRNA hydrolase, PTH2 family